MFQNAKHITLTITSGASFSSAINVERYDALMVYFPVITGRFGAASIEASLYGSYDSGVTGVPVNYYNYGTGAIGTAKVTAATGGVYEMPYGGSLPRIQLVFNTACTGGASIELVYHQV
jgi:hypothetical protein